MLFWSLKLNLVFSFFFRIASMYYYEQGFTKLRERVPGETSYHRLSRETRFKGKLRPLRCLHSDNYPILQDNLSVIILSFIYAKVSKNLNYYSIACVHVKWTKLIFIFFKTMLTLKYGKWFLNHLNTCNSYMLNTTQHRFHLLRTYHNFYNTDPRGKDESYIKRWLKNDFIAKWERVQWWWLRESTETRELSETIELMQSRFLVGVRER